MSSSELVIRHEGVGDTCCPVPWAVLTVDGRFVTRTDANQLRERRLTPAGVQRVRDELIATGLFERDQAFPLELLPGATPPAHGIGGWSFKAWRDTRIVEVGTAMHQGAEESYYQPSAARTRLDRLSKQLRNPETWLPGSAWADPTPRQYEPAAFVLLLRMEPGVQNARPTIDELGVTWPFSAGPLALGATLPPAAGPFAETTRCSALTREDMLAVKDSIVRAGGSDGMQTSPDGAFTVGFGAHGQQSGLVVMVRPLLPDRASCNGEYVQ